MLKTLISRLRAPASAPAAVPARELALAALMVRIARADGDYDDSERIRIERVLARRDNLAPDAARDARLRAEAIEAGAADTVRFTRALKEMIALEDRIGVIEALWEVALADGARGADEDAQIRLASNLLGVSDLDSALARRRVNQQLG
jgi:uncharacterized tellurite resistance protein B-like protein